MAYHDYSWYTDRVPVTYNWDELVQFAQLQQGQSWNEIVNRLNSFGLPVENAADVAMLAGLEGSMNVDGTFTAWVYNDKVGTFNYNPSVSSANNISSRAAVRAPINTTVTTVTDPPTVQFSTTPKSGSFTQDAIYLFGEVGQAVSATATGISLGKAIDARLYNANPEFWDSIGMSSLNPETWASITAGDTSLGATLFNFVFGIDANTGKAQAYMDADAYAYMAYWMKTQGLFEIEDKTAPENFPIDLSVCTPVKVEGALSYNYRRGSRENYLVELTFSATDAELVVYTINNASAGTYIVFIATDTAKTITYYIHSKRTRVETGVTEESVTPMTVTTGSPYTYDGKTAYHSLSSTGGSSSYTNIYISNTFARHLTSDEERGLSWVLLYGDTSGGIDGITSQPNAQLPDTSTWTDIPSTDSYLRSAYPDMYSDALQYDALQPDGSVLTKTYIPVPMPDNTTSPDTQHANNPWDNQQPTSDGATQTTTEIDIATSPDELIKQLIKTITQTVQITNTENPTTTGTGDTPTLVPIAGTATALWSVYNPTKAQIDSFGAWLWTDNVIQQFIQLLNNPMEGIITLHKVFAAPVVSGSGTIVVGRLDSGVGSNLVAQQYVTVDCGSVTLDEYFGSVFDYSPYTTVSLYLPFIGFVPLNVDDVMRSTISITYGVDVFTGACLATINVERDGNSVGMYQYSGVASVEYPLTGAQHGGLVNGLLGVAGGVAGIALASTGVGVVAGASAIAGGLTNAAKTSNARSGGFSGNAGAMGVKIPYLIIERPITKVASTFDVLNGYPTNHSVRLGDCSGNVVVKYVHVEGITATEQELALIETILKSGVVV